MSRRETVFIMPMSAFIISLQLIYPPVSSAKYQGQTEISGH